MIGDKRIRFSIIRVIDVKQKNQNWSKEKMNLVKVEPVTNGVKLMVNGLSEL